MATVSITVPDAIVPRVLAALRAQYPQYSQLSDAQAFKAVTADFWRGVLFNYERQQAIIAAQDSVRAQVQAAIDGANAAGGGIS
jgi:hypothetical protein